MEFLPGLHWIEGKQSNIYLWESEEGFLLIDTGVAGDADKILNYIEEMGHQPKDVTAILITHADIDHAGGAAILQAHTGSIVYTGSQTAELLSEGKSPKHMPRVVQFIVDNFMGYTPVPADVIQVIAEGEIIPELEELRIVATPGHTLDHHSFCSDMHGILFTGDALSMRGDRLKNTPKRITADHEAARQSAMRLLRLHPAVFACGHGRPLQNHDANEIMTLYRQLDQSAAS